MCRRTDPGRIAWWALVGCLAGATTLGGAEPPALDRFIAAAATDAKVADAALAEIGRSWKDGYATMIVDMARLMRGPRRGPAEAPEPAFSNDDEIDRNQAAGRAESGVTATGEPGSPSRRRLLAFLERQTGKRFGDDLTRWRAWMWQRPYEPHPDYASFKGLVCQRIDPRMRAFFRAGVRTAIRLDEIDWGGVIVDGIPPLRQPRVVAAVAASYLKDSNVVFGVVVNGEARAYPKRILGWHEIAIDRVGGVDLTIVYCTLCGTVIPFESRAGGRTFQFGTSGLLYRLYAPSGEERAQRPAAFTSQRRQV